MGIFAKILSFLTNPIADLTGSYRERKKIAAESARDIAQAEVDFKVAKLVAKTRRLEEQETNDADYDMQVLKNRAETFMDDFFIIVFLTIFIMHFIPATQPYMHKGWLAMGYNGVPWFMEFILVGVAVSTLGLMRLFRVFFRMKNDKNQRAS